MSTFVDAMLVRLSTQDGLRRLALPPGDTERARLRALLTEVYDLSDATLHAITEVTVHGVDCQHPIFPPVRRTGSWLQTIPSNTRADFTVDGAAGNPQWIDLIAELTVTALLEVDPGGMESFSATEGELTTGAEFELRLRPKPPFDPADPANLRRFPLPVAIFVRDTLDLAGALRDIRRVAAGRPVVARQVGSAEVAANHAAVLVLPAGIAAGSGLTPEQITEFLAGQRVLAVFEQL